MTTTTRRGLGIALVAVVAMVAASGVVIARAAVDFELGGSVGDASCDVEDVEGANEAQLHSILSELTNTTFFRLFQVDLKRTCKFWGKGEDAGPSCTAPSGDVGSPFTSASPSRESDASGSFSVGGIGSSEPPKTMCSLDLENKDGVGMLWSPMTDSVDRTISKPEEKALTSMEEPDVDCSDEELPTFWTDMCHKFAPEEQTEYVNLQLNPERWTGYNGSHVWRAIYEENCMKSALSVDEMCYEERVLYRLLSGMHASINIHIALHSKPPKRALGETEWGSDPKKFMDLFGKHPDRLKNLHFSFVVLLRALRKATPAMSQMDVSIGQDREEDLRTQALMRRLLDSHILSSCRDVFGAFDEKSLFRDVQSTLNSDIGKIDQLNPNDLAPVSLKSQFKDIFLNISEVMDCITCQKCKLHGKLQLLGLGTALKVLLLPEDLLASSLNQQEVVALVNTIAKFSHAIRRVPDLLNAARQEALKGESDFMVDSDATRDDGTQSGQSALEAAIAATAAHVKSGVLSGEAETKILDALLENDSKVSILAKYYAESMPLRFVEHALRALGLPPLATSAVDEPVDLVVVGGGLAGLTASLTVLDRGGRVTLVEKEAFVGGNSQWASSGINGVIETARDENPDSVGAYRDDCEKSSYGNGNGADGLDPETIEHIPTLTSKAGETIEWLRQRAGADLSLLSRLGGHSHARTYRPNEGMAGSSLIFALKAKCEEYMDSGRFKVVKKARVTGVSTDGDGQIVGVRWTPADGSDGGGEVKALNVLLATGGYSNDKHGAGALLNMYAPHLTKFATTNTKGTTGDGHKLAFSLGAGAVDMERVQVHPTGFINPEDESADTKTLAAELLRGAGGILLTRSGVRFANELGTRDYVSSRMQEEDEEKLDFVLLLNEKAANEANKHVPLYLKKKLLNKFDSLAELTEWMSSRGNVSVETLKNTLVTYNQDSERGRDIFNKTFFANVPFNLDGPYYAGRVTPVVHYTMGGVKVDDSGRVVRPDGSRVNGLYAAGEIIGGVHGKNRLGGNALTECAVFGRLVGQDIEIEATKAAPAPSATTAKMDAPPRQTKDRDINAAELAKHNTMTDCWVALYGKVYDFTDFLEDHPAGADAILRYSGADGTDIFESVHSRNMLDEFEPIGTFLVD